MSKEKSNVWDLAASKAEEAIKQGALCSIPTKQETITENNHPFLIRILSGKELKEEACKKERQILSQTGHKINPFLPYDENLFVAELSYTHICLLNKFNVCDNHLLVVTKQYEAQYEALNQRDFQALAYCMENKKSLGFYNSGPEAGASQEHKHLQVVPLPFAEDFPNNLVDSVLKEYCEDMDCWISPDLPFKHGFWPLAETETTPNETARLLYDGYMNLTSIFEIFTTHTAYNLLVTDEWMVMIPRTQEKFHTISVNALGFAGSLFVKTDDELALLKETGPFGLLKAIGD